MKYINYYQRLKTKDMDIDEILERHKYLVRVETDSSIIEDPYKRAIKEIVEATIDMCADEGKCYISNYSHNGEQYCDIEVDKKSILKLKNKIKY